MSSPRRRRIDQTATTEGATLATATAPCHPHSATVVRHSQSLAGHTVSPIIRLLTPSLSFHVIRINMVIVRIESTLSQSPTAPLTLFTRSSSSLCAPLPRRRRRSRRRRSGAWRWNGGSHIGMFAAVLIDLVQGLQLGDRRELRPMVRFLHCLAEGREFGATARRNDKDEIEKLCQLNSRRRCPRIHREYSREEVPLVRTFRLRNGSLHIRGRGGSGASASPLLLGRCRLCSRSCGRRSSSYSRTTGARGGGLVRQNFLGLAQIKGGVLAVRLVR